MDKDNAENWLKDKLSRIFDKEYIFIVGRATTAIYLALRAKRFDEGEVVLPDVLCPSPANAVLYSGLNPVFCDVELKNFNMSIDSLRKIVSKKTRAVIPAHLFGQPVKMDEVQEIADKFNLFVIEDAAQALGGEYKGRKLGSWGDVSVVSFGGKIVDASDGGAVLTDSAELAENISQEIKYLPSRLDNKEELLGWYKKFFYFLRDVSRRTDLCNFLYWFAPHIFKRIYIYKAEVTEISKEIISEFENLDQYTKRRRENAEMYHERLQHPKIDLPEYDSEGTFYRYSVLVEKGYQEKVTNALRERGYDASNLYEFPLHKLYPHKQRADFRNSNEVSNRIVNLWVEPGITEKYIEGACETIINALEE